MKKSIAVALYVVYSVFITFFIVYGGSVSNALIHEAKSQLYIKDISDVEVSIPTDASLISGRWYYPVYTAVGKFYDAGLQFESLDPDIMTVTKNGAVYAYNGYAGDTVIGRVRIRSQYDKDFEKIVTYRFCKLYPEIFTTSYASKSYGADGIVSVGVPVYVYSTIPADVDYNVYGYEVLYDETYFTRREDGALIPIIPTPEGIQTSFTVRYANGAESESEPFSIFGDTQQATAIDEIRLDSQPIGAYDMIVDRSAKITLYYRGERVHGDFAVTFEDAADGYFNKAYDICFKNPGDKSFTVTLPNGFSESFTVSVRNRLSLPTLSDEELAKTKHITIFESELPRYYYTFPSNVTAKPINVVHHDESIAWIYATDTYFAIEPQKAGTTEFALLVSDGYEYLYMDFTLEIREDNSLSFFLIDNVGKIVAKYIGHLTLFVILSWLALNSCRYIKTKNVIFRFLRYTMCALPIAAVTEYWQTFLPQRTGSVEDVLVDMGSYYFGTLIALCAVAIYRACKRKRAQRTPTTPAPHESAEALQ